MSQCRAHSARSARHHPSDSHAYTSLRPFRHSLSHGNGHPCGAGVRVARSFHFHGHNNHNRLVRGPWCRTRALKEDLGDRGDGADDEQSSQPTSTSSSSSSSSSPSDEISARLKEFAQNLTDKDNKGKGIELGPIALSFGETDESKETPSSSSSSSSSSPTDEISARLKEFAQKLGGDDTNGKGLELGPIALSFNEDDNEERTGEDEEQVENSSVARKGLGATYSETSMSTEEWRAKYEKDGAVDLWVEEEFNAGSRLVGGRAVHLGRLPGQGSGEGPGLNDNVTMHTVTIQGGADDGSDITFEAAEDRYILFSAEAEGFSCPHACRNGCCTACTMTVVSGDVKQEQALGLNKRLKEEGYVLTCVAFPRSDLVLAPVPEEEAYQRQFGEAFDAMATNPNDPMYIERDDFALEIADMDE